MTAVKFKTFDERAARAFLAAILDPAVGCVELRLFRATFDRTGHVVEDTKYNSTHAGWYNNADSLVCDLKRLDGVSAYATVNPVSLALLARSANKLTRVGPQSKIKHATSDDDVVCLRWLYVDVDPVKPDPDVSATDDEHAAAIARRDLILAEHPDLAASALWGSSGNGGWILVRLPDYPNDNEHRGLIADALAALAARYSDGVATVDVKTKNPSRVMCVPGTLKTKGSHVPDRPWRLVTLDKSADQSEGEP